MDAQREVFVPIAPDGTVLPKNLDGSYIHPDSGEPMSKNGLKKFCKAQQRDKERTERKRKQAECSQASIEFLGPSAGKQAKARQVRLGIVVAPGSAPVMLAEHKAMIQSLEELETAARVSWLPDMLQRAHVPVDCHGSLEVPSTATPAEQQELPEGWFTLRESKLRAFSIELLGTQPLIRSLVWLDLSRNELSELPSLDELQSLTTLDLSRNWFRDMPAELGVLSQLATLNISRNMLRGTGSSIGLATLKGMPQLRHLDVTFNQKCNRQSLADLLRSDLPQLHTLALTISHHNTDKPAPEGEFEGDCAANRDATMLRSQLEPFGTSILRRRLAADFGGPPTDPEQVHRAEVMQMLLGAYKKENNGGERQLLRVLGKPVSSGLIGLLLEELKAWSSNPDRVCRERPSIQAGSYMILRSPAEFLQKSSLKAKQAATKLAKNQHLWDLAQQAMAEVDEEFSNKFTALAVTLNFQGSPHIDKQNVGPFYGLSMGDFADGQGGIRVECSPRIVAEVNTKNRLGKVDGRFPHWVAPYDQQTTRYSLIYYQTEGRHTTVGPAIFSMPVQE